MGTVSSPFGITATSHMRVHTHPIPAHTPHIRMCTHMHTHAHTPHPSMGTGVHTHAYTSHPSMGTRAGQLVLEVSVFHLSVSKPGML